MVTRDAVRAWQVLRRIPAYLSRRWRRAPTPGLPERVPFPVRLQTVTDLAAVQRNLALEHPAERLRIVRPGEPESIDVSPETIRNWEQGKRCPTGAARALLRALDRAPETALRVQ